MLYFVFSIDAITFMLFLRTKTPKAASQVLIWQSTEY